MAAATGPQFLFISGAEGSGTTLLRRILAAPPQCASVGRDIVKVPDHPDALPLFQAFNEANERLWDRRLPLAMHEQARADVHRAALAIAHAPVFAACSQLVFKRSSPFGGGDEHRPDLFDVAGLPVGSRIVLIYRDPCAATYSALRRAFDTDLRRLAARCADHLTWLAAQHRGIDPKRILVVSYRRLCETPQAELERLSAFCGFALDAGDIQEPLERNADARYRRELSPSQVAWLEAYFATRRGQWESLTG